MNILTIAIKAEGTAAKLSRKLGISPARLGNWKKRGVPGGWVDSLSFRYAKQIKQAQAEAANAQ